MVGLLSMTLAETRLGIKGTCLLGREEDCLEVMAATYFMGTTAKVIEERKRSVGIR